MRIIGFLASLLLAPTNSHANDTRELAHFGVSGATPMSDATPISDATNTPITIGRFHQLHIVKKLNPTEEWKVLSGSLDINGIVVNSQDIELSCNDDDYCEFYFMGNSLKGKSFADWCVDDGNYKIQNLEIGVAGIGERNPIWNHNQDGFGDTNREAMATLLDGNGTAVSLSTFCDGNADYDDYDDCRSQNPVREAEIIISHTQSQYESCEKFNERSVMDACGSEVAMDGSLQEFSSNVAQVASKVQEYEVKGMYAFTSGSSPNDQAPAENNDRALRGGRNLFLAKIHKWWDHLVYDGLIVPSAGDGVSGTFAIFGIAQMACNNFVSVDWPDWVKKTCSVLGGDDVDGDAQREADIQAIKENTEEILSKLKDLEKSLESSFTRVITSVVGQVLAYDARIEMQDYLHRLSSLDISYRDFVASQSMTQGVRVNYEELFREACTEPGFTPIDIFRYFYGHACEDCNAITGGSKNIAYFLQVFVDHAKAQNDWKLKGSTFRTGFGVVVINALYKARFLQTMCLPAKLASVGSDVYDPCIDTIRKEHLDEMQTAFAEVVGHLIEEEIENELNYFKLVKARTEESPMQVGCLELDTYNGFGHCSAGDDKQVWRLDINQKLVNKADPNKCVGFNPNSGEVLFQNCADAPQIRWSNANNGFVAVGDNQCTSLSRCSGSTSFEQIFDDMPTCFSHPTDQCVHLSDKTMKLTIKDMGLNAYCREWEDYWSTTDLCDFSVDITKIVWGNGGETGSNGVEFETRHESDHPRWTGVVKTYTKSFQAGQNLRKGPAVHLRINEYGENQRGGFDQVIQLPDITDEDNKDIILDLSNHINRKFDGDAHVQDVIFKWQYYKD